MTDTRPQGVNTRAQPDRARSVMGSNDDDERYASCDGRPLILSWTINRHLFYTFEVDIDEAERIVPAPLQVVELRPSVALMSVGVLRYEPGHFGPGSPVFLEVVGAIHVSPDLSTDMPVPTMTFSTFQVLSDSPDFVASEDDTLNTPTRLASLEARFTEDGLGVEAWDEDGPILAMPSAHTEPRWVHKEMWGQHFTNTKGLQHGLWQWDGRLFEHQKRLPGWRLHPHPFWSGLDVGGVRSTYRTMLQEPGTLCHERFYAMRPFGS
jgi:hypothetical protein